MVRVVHRLFKLTHNKSIAALPKPYLDYLEESRAPPERVVDSPPDTKYLDYDQDYETGYVYRKPDQPIPVIRPPRAENALWGGLGMVEGFKKPKKLKPRWAQLWWPTLERHTFYSDILDVHINVEVTERTLELIDNNQGFDFYILKTPIRDLGSEFGRRLKHKMLLALARDDREYIRKKYKDYIRPVEEVAWHGLKENEALSKFRLMRVEETIDPPLRLTYARQLIEELKSQDKQKQSAQE